MTELNRLIEKYRQDRGGLIPLLQEAQELQGYLPRWMLEQIARGLKISLAQVLGVATFYSQFYLKPRGRHTIRVCSGTACHVRGGAAILDKIRHQLQANDGDTTADGRFTLEKVACIGACSLAPVVVVDEDTHGRLTPDQVPCILEKYQ